MTTDEDILAEAQRFYQNLYGYKSSDDKIHNELLDQLEGKLSEEMKASCEEPITNTELAVLQKDAHEQVPGTRWSNN